MLALRKRRLFLVAICALMAFSAVFWIQPLGALSLIERLTPNEVYRVPTDHPLVALSFDDGPNPSFTPQVLDILERNHAKATFFLIGERASQHQELVARIKAEGHEVGNHYYKNGSTLFHSDAQFVSYLEQTEKAIGPMKEPKLFRAPGGVAWPGQLRLAQAHGYKCVLGSAYPHDPMRPPVWYIRWLAGKNLAPGTIVILHDGIKDPTRSIQALPRILDEGRRKGLSFVSIGELLKASRQKSPKVGVEQSPTSANSW
jgi:peptidoglycan/xylan/chitin deacetylase (PgdA/CDA1 family)